MYGAFAFEYSDVEERRRLSGASAQEENQGEEEC
jgi:hypothetical protein